MPAPPHWTLDRGEALRFVPLLAHRGSTPPTELEWTVIAFPGSKAEARTIEHSTVKLESRGPGAFELDGRKIPVHRYHEVTAHPAGSKAPATEWLVTDDGVLIQRLHTDEPDPDPRMEPFGPTVWMTDFVPLRGDPLHPGKSKAQARAKAKAKAKPE